MLLENRLTIKSWAEEDRPREKMRIKGRSALSDAELIALLIGSGNREETALELSKRILMSVENNLNELGKLSIEDLTKGFKGIGEAKAILICAAFELGRRKSSSDGLQKRQITSSKDAADIMQPLLADHHHEEFWVLFLSRSNRLISFKQMSSGGMTGTVADGKDIFRSALEHKAVSIILCHNHPSGNLKPSEADSRLTKRLTQAGLALEIPVLDHIIVADSGFFSFADEGMM